jgi:uncharacterized protein
VITRKDGSKCFVWDVHTHMGVSTGFKAWGMNELSGALMIERMDAAGVDMICTFAAGAPHTNYMESNQYIVNAARQYPDRIYPFARVHPLFDKNDNVDHIRSLIPQGLKGIKFHPFRDGAYPPNDAALVYPLMEEIKTHDLVVLFHAGEQITCSPALIAEVARDFPTVRIIIAHLGTYGFHHEAIAAAKRVDNVFVDTSTIEQPRVIRMFQRAVGGQRLLYGSDHPYMHFPAELDKVIKYAELEEDEITAILGANTAKLFGLDEDALAKAALRRNGHEAKVSAGAP